MLKLLKIILVNLIWIPSIAFSSPTATTRNLNPKEQHALADAIKDLEICELVEKAQSDALMETQEKVDRDSQWWASPTIVVNGVIVSFGLGILVAPLLLNH